MLIFENDFAPLVGAAAQSLPRIERYVTIDEKIPPADLYLRRSAGARPRRAPDIFTFDENAIAELFYTSGSTGTPKGVMLSHRTLYLHALSVSVHVLMKDTDVDLHTIPLFHANGWGRPQSVHHAGHQAGDGAALRASLRVPPDPGGESHGHVAGAHHGQRAAQLPRPRQFDISSMRRSTSAARRLRRS